MDIKQDLSKYAWLIIECDDYIIVQTKSHKDILKIQKVGSSYSLSQILRGEHIELLNNVNSSELTTKVEELMYEGTSYSRSH